MSFLITGLTSTDNNIADIEEEDEEEEEENECPSTPIASCFVPDEEEVIVDLKTAARELFKRQHGRYPSEEELNDFISELGEIYILESYRTLKRTLQEEKRKEGAHREFLFSFIYYMKVNEIDLETLRKVRSIISSKSLKFLHYFLLDTEGQNGVVKLSQIWGYLKQSPARYEELLNELILLFRTCLRHNYGVQHIVNGTRLFDDLITTWYFARNQNRLMVRILELMTFIIYCCDDVYRKLQEFEETREESEKEKEIFMTQSMMISSVVKARKKLSSAKLDGNYDQIQFRSPAYKRFLRSFKRFKERMNEAVTYQTFVDRMVQKSGQHNYVTQCLTFVNQMLHSTRFHHDEKNQKKFLEQILSVGGGSLMMLIKGLSVFDPGVKLKTQIKEFQSLLVFDNEYEDEYQKLPMEKMRQLFVQMKGRQSWMYLTNILQRFHRLNSLMENEYRRRVESSNLFLEEEIEEKVSEMMDRNWKRIENIVRMVKFKKDLSKNQQGTTKLPSRSEGDPKKSKSEEEEAAEFSEDEFNLVFGEDVEHSVEFKNLLKLLSTKKINEIQEDEISPRKRSTEQPKPSDDPKRTSGAVKLFRRILTIVNSQSKDKDEEIIELKKKLTDLRRKGLGGGGLGGIGSKDDGEPIDIDEFDIIPFDEVGKGQGGPVGAPAPPPPPPPPPMDPKVYNNFDITKFYRENKSRYENEYTLRNLSVTRLKNDPESKSIFLSKKIAKTCLSKFFSDLDGPKKEVKEEEVEGEEEEKEENEKNCPRRFLKNLVETFSKKKMPAGGVPTKRKRRKKPTEGQISFLETKKRLDAEIVLRHQNKTMEKIIKLVMRFETNRIPVDVIGRLMKIFPQDASKRVDFTDKIEEYFNRPPTPVQNENEGGQEGGPGQPSTSQGEGKKESPEKLRSMRMKRLSTADRFIVKQIEIPHYLERLQCWYFMKNFYQQSIDRVKLNLSRLECAFDMLIEGKGGFLDFLRYVLVVANTLNSKKYPVYSFRISNLSNLSMMKPFSTSGPSDDQDEDNTEQSSSIRVKNSLLFVLLEFVYLNNPSSLEFVDLYQEKFKFEMSLKEMIDVIVKLKRELERVRIHRERIGRVKDKFPAESKIFIAHADNEILEIEERIIGVTEKLTLLSILYAEELKSEEKKIMNVDDDDGSKNEEQKKVSSSLMNLKEGFFKELDEFLEICKKDLLLVKKYVELEQRDKRLQKKRENEMMRMMQMQHNNQGGGGGGGQMLRNLEVIQRIVEGGRQLREEEEENRNDDDVGDERTVSQACFDSDDDDELKEEEKEGEDD